MEVEIPIPFYANYGHFTIDGDIEFASGDSLCIDAKIVDGIITVTDVRVKTEV